MLRKETEREIQKINDFEKIWKIKTNMTKFNIVPIVGKRGAGVRVEGREIGYSKETKALGLTITNTGFVKHVSNRIGLARMQTGRLYRLRKLSAKTKRLLYLTTVRSVLVYPAIPLHIQSRHQLNRMQVVQNKAARIITNTRLIEGKTKEEVNELAELEEVSEYLDRQAGAIWEKVRQHEGNLEQLEFRGREKAMFRSSRAAAVGGDS